MIAFDHVTLAQRVLFGTGRAVANVADAVGSLAAKRVQLIASGSAGQLGDAIARVVPVTARIDEVVQHVPARNAALAVTRAQQNDADLVVAVGGGSSIGLAKAVAKETGLPIVAVPTTFAGSEATDVWGITAEGRKVTGSDPRVLPRVVVYDAELSASLPGRLAVASGINAIAHAVDGLWAPRTDPINTALGTEALRTLIPGLRGLAGNPGDMDAREKTLYGAYLAASAFASAGSGLHHKICHALGGTFGLPHAETHAVVIPYVAEFNGEAAPDAAARISDAVGHVTPGRGLYELRRELGAPGSLRELGFAEADILRASEVILPTIPPSNPRRVTPRELERLLHAAWAGDPVEGPNHQMEEER